MLPVKKQIHIVRILWQHKDNVNPKSLYGVKSSWFSRYIILLGIFCRCLFLLVPSCRFLKLIAILNIWDIVEKIASKKFQIRRSSLRKARSVHFDSEKLEVCRRYQVSFGSQFRFRNISLRIVLSGRLNPLISCAISESGSYSGRTSGRPSDPKARQSMSEKCSSDNSIETHSITLVFGENLWSHGSKMW